MFDNPDLSPIPLEEEKSYTGSWEQGDRSLNAAAVFAALGIGIFYAVGQTIFFVVALAASGAITAEPTGSSTSFWERMSEIMELQAEPIRIALVLSQFLCMLLPTIWLVRLWHTGRVREYIRLKGCSIWEILLAMAITLLLIPTGTYVANFISQQLNISDDMSKAMGGLFAAHSLPEFIWVVFVVAVTPAICEEILFRGYVQRTFERTVGWKSILVTGVFFGLFHFQPLGLITLSLIGIVLGYFYYRSKSLLPSMAAHFTNNFIAVYVLYQSSTIAGTDLASSDQVPLVWVLVTLPAAVALLVVYHFITAARQTGMPGEASSRFVSS